MFEVPTVPELAIIEYDFDVVSEYTKGHSVLAFLNGIQSALIFFCYPGLYALNGFEVQSYICQVVYHLANYNTRLDFYGMQVHQIYDMLDKLQYRYVCPILMGSL